MSPTPSTTGMSEPLYTPACPPPSAPQAPETPVQPTTSRESGRGRKRRAEHLDEDEHFFMSLIPAAKRLPPRKRANIKVKFMQILMEAEFGEDDQV